MKKIRANKLTAIAFISLAVSILSVFTTIIGYTNRQRIHRNFTLLHFLSSDGNGFESFVLREYTGHVYMNIDMTTVRIFVAIGIAAILCALIGLFLISNQKENRVSFILTLAGLVGTVAPSLLILICVILLGNDFYGTISCGIYPIVSPIAMIVCILAATKMHRNNIANQKSRKELCQLIRRGGEL